MNIIVYIPKWGNFLKVSEGTGDNLLDEDIEEGYKDYYEYTTFCMTADGELIEGDGGMGMCEELLSETCADAEDMLRMCLDSWFGSLKSDEYVIINTGD